MAELLLRPFRRLSLFAAGGLTAPGPPRIPREVASGGRTDRRHVRYRGASIAWTADLTGASGDEVRLDVLACEVGDPMPADDAGSSYHKPFEPPDPRILWFRAHRLGFRGSEPASMSHLQHERGSSHLGIAS